jgi:hypothetical protein
MILPEELLLPFASPENILCRVSLYRVRVQSEVLRQKINEENLVIIDEERSSVIGHRFRIYRDAMSHHESR